jgi:prepilin-type N-terminal cleavage/methylation domain-containing protein
MITDCAMRRLLTSPGGAGYARADACPGLPGGMLKWQANGPGPQRRNRATGSRRSAAGFSLIETVMVVAIAGVMLAISLPIATNIYQGYHLSAASSAIAGAVQSTRYQALMVGCLYTLTLTSGTTTYQVAAQAVSGAPPACATAFTNVGGAIPWSTSGDISMNAGAATTSLVLTFSPNGTVTATGGLSPCTNGVGCLVLSNAKTTNTIYVSGVGNVTVTSP